MVIGLPLSELMRVSVLRSVLKGTLRMAGEGAKSSVSCCTAGSSTKRIVSVGLGAVGETSFIECSCFKGDGEGLRLPFRTGRSRGLTDSSALSSSLFAFCSLSSSIRRFTLASSNFAMVPPGGV